MNRYLTSSPRAEDAGPARLPGGWSLRPVGSRTGRYERRTDAGLDLVSLHTRDGRFLEASPAAFPLLGLAPEHLLDMSWESLAHPSDRDRVASWWRSLPESGSGQLTFRARRDDEIVWVECTAWVHLADDQVSYVEATTRDVTRHRWHSEELSRRCLELEEQSARLDQANRELLVLAADAAHDLRAPVQVITGFAELLANREGARLDHTSQEFLAHILSAAGSMRALVEAVLEHSRAQSAPLDPGPVDCNELLAEVVARLHGEIADRGAEVEIEQLPCVYGDWVQLGRVFQNLISNAISAVPPDRLPRIRTAAVRLPWQWKLFVVDNGAGIPPQDRTRIFEPFQRSETNGRRSTGLGLAICKAIVERHQGRIWVENSTSQGSQFSVTLPIAPDGN